jgi:hypothetical protein
VLDDGAASRPYSINAAVWTAFVAVNGVCTAAGPVFEDSTRHAIVSVLFGSLMVHRQQWDTSWGAKKFNFLIRDIDDATRAGASMESSRFVVLGSPGGRLESLLDVRNRLHACVGASVNRYISVQVLSTPLALVRKDPTPLLRRQRGTTPLSYVVRGATPFSSRLAQKLADAAGSPKNRRMRCRRLPDPRPIPEGVRGPICIRKK